VTAGDAQIDLDPKADVNMPDEADEKLRCIASWCKGTDK
jgi:hypothetical protein